MRAPLRPTLVAQKPRQPHQGGSEQGVAEAGSEVAFAQDGEDGRDHLYLERAVHPGTAQRSAGTVGELGGKVQMDGLVLMHRPVAQLKEPHTQCDYHNGEEPCFEPSATTQPFL